MAKRNLSGQNLIRAALFAALLSTGPNTAHAAWSTLVSNGAPSNRVDLVFLGDGYTLSDLNAGTYASHIESFLDHLFASPNFLADPFPRYRNYFNAHKIDVISNQSGADDPVPNGIFRNTALDATYDAYGIDRLLTINESKANDQLIANLAGSAVVPDIRLVTVNANQYGGSGGTYAVFAGGNHQARDIALHELSHAFSDTADEYETQSGVFPSAEPSARNATKDASGEKWSHWLGFEDPRGDWLDIGIFEGAAFYSQGVYRPSLDSKMRTLEQPFNAVVREKTILDIYSRVDPLDDWLEDSTTFAGSQLWVDSIDPEVISVDWYVNGQLVAPDHGEQFDLAEFRSAAGIYSVRAHAYDTAVRHAGDGSLLDLVRTNLSALQQEITWTVTFPGLPLAGDYNSDRVVNDADYQVWKSSFGSIQQLAADGNKNGIVDSADYALWRNQRSATPALSGATQLGVPEPSGWQLAVAVALAVFFGRRRV